MSTPVSVQTITAVRNRLLTISEAAGFNTTPTVLEIGQQPALLSDLSCDFVLGLFEQPDTPTQDETICGQQMITQNIVIEGAARRQASSNELQLLMWLWQDLMRAVFNASDTTLNGIAMAVQRGPKAFIYSQTGEGMAGVQQIVSVQYFETYGNP